jgi:hypothetical protein
MSVFDCLDYLRDFGGVGIYFFDPCACVVMCLCACLLPERELQCVLSLVCW